MSSFERIGCIPELIRAVDQLGWLLPTPVQDEAIPLILGGGDVMVAAETGSGKTGAFALPILQIVYETLRGEGGTSETPINNKKLTELPKVQLSPQNSDEFFEIAPNSGGLVGESSANWQGGRTNVGITKGKYYYEVTIIRGLCRVGWCTMAHKPIKVGTDAQSYGYGGTGKKAFNGEFINYGKPMKESDIVGCMIDLNKNQISYSLNGEFLGVAFGNIGKGPWYPCATVKNGSLEFNFGRTKFKYNPPKGFIGVQSANYNNTNLLFAQQQKSISNSKGGNPVALCVAPTRDLADQIYRDFISFTKYLDEPPVNVALCIGGAAKMMHEIKKAHIVVGTIGSLIGLLKSEAMTLAKCKFFVIDEADRVLDKKQGNQEDILRIYSRLPNGVQVMLFSATLHSDDITQMSKKICRNPQWVDLKGKEYVPDTVHHCILACDPLQDLSWTQRNNDIITDGVHQSDRIQYNVHNGTNLSKLTISEAVKRLKPLLLKKVIDAFEMDQCLVFCRTRLDCNNINHYLTRLGGGRAFRGGPDAGAGIQNKYSCAELHSGIPQRERIDNLQYFKSGAVRFLICTDVAARGIDIKQLPFVINVTMPAESEDYIHRVGRVGRADEHGIAISLVSKYQEKVWYHKCASRGNNCTDTRLVDEGGCTIWYEEAKIFSEVEKRLGNVKIPSMKPEQCVKGNAKNFVKSIELKDPLLAAASKKVEALKPRIEELGMLEVEAQNQFLQMPFLFNDMCVGRGRGTGGNNNRGRGRGRGGRGRGNRGGYNNSGNRGGYIPGQGSSGWDIDNFGYDGRQDDGWGNNFGNNGNNNSASPTKEFDDDEDNDAVTTGNNNNSGNKKKKKRRKKKKKAGNDEGENEDGPMKG